MNRFLNTDKIPSAAIVLVNYNGMEDTRKCLNSIERNLKKKLMVVVVDNASLEDPNEILRKEFPWCVVLRSKTNEGWAGGNNIGIQHSLGDGAEYVILLNNDTVVSEDMVTRLIEAANAYPEFGIIGPIINDMKYPDEVQTDGCLFNRTDAEGFFQRKAIRIKRCSPPSVTEVDIVNGCCMIISRGVFDNIGLIDERFYLIHEESDFCLRAYKAGFRSGIIGEPLVWHKHSASFDRAGNWRQRYYDTRNLFLLLRSHGKLHKNSRSVSQSWLAYLKYVYYCYCLEREHDSEQGSNAVVQGICDALFGCFGPWKPCKNIILRPVQVLLETAWKYRGSKSHKKYHT